MIKAAHSAAAVLELREAAHARGLTLLSRVCDTGHTHIEKTTTVCVVEIKSTLGFFFFFFALVNSQSRNTVAASVELNSVTQEWQGVHTDRHVSRCCVNMCVSASVRRFPSICRRHHSCFRPVCFIPQPPKLRTASLVQRHRQPPAPKSSLCPSVCLSVHIYISKHRRPHLTGPHQRLRGGILARFTRPLLGLRNMLI